MSSRLDRTEQRIVGVLLEKALGVPDVYPMTENALLDGCNQKSNRDPVLELESFQLAGALLSLREKGWVVRVEGNRATRYKHLVAERLGLTPAEQAVFAELLLRGPQAPGALKPRVQRMGFHGEPERVEAVLRGMAARPQPLVEQLPLGSRERDRRWRHLVGDGSEGAPAPAEVEAGGALRTGEARRAAEAEHAPPPSVATGAMTPSPHVGGDANALETRVAALERQVAELAARLRRLEPGEPGTSGDG